MLINPWRMHHGVLIIVQCMCVCACVSVCCLLQRNLLHTSLLCQKQSFIGFFMEGFCHVAFAENALFKSSGVICWSPPPSSLPSELSMDKQDSNGFFSTRIVCMASDRSSNMTGSSQIVAHWQISFLAICICYKLLTQHCMLSGTRDTAGHYAIAHVCNVHSCGLLLGLCIMCM